MPEIYMDDDGGSWVVIEGTPYCMYRGSFEDHGITSVDQLETIHGPLTKYRMEY